MDVLLCTDDVIDVLAVSHWTRRNLLTGWITRMCFFSGFLTWVGEDGGRAAWDEMWLSSCVQVLRGQAGGVQWSLTAWGFQC